MQPLTAEAVERRLRTALDGEQHDETDRCMRWLDEHDAREHARRGGVTLAQAAAYYAKHGLHVFPLQPGAKLPYVRSHGCKDATDDADQIAAWWHAAPDSNVGIATGHRVDVIDIDGPSGNLSYARIGGFPTPLGTVSTPRAGGRHLYVRATGVGNRARIATGIDYRGSGGYVVAPPSVNGDGTAYRWLAPLNLDEGDPRTHDAAL